MTIHVDAPTARKFSSAARIRPRSAGALLAIALIASGLPAQEEASLTARGPLEAWLCAPGARQARVLEAPARAAWSGSLPDASGTLPSGFHVLALPGAAPYSRQAAVIIPARPAPGPLPVAIILGPPPHRPPDEIVLRAIYGAWLERGWALLAPERGRIDPSAPSLSERIGGFLALLSRRHPLDRDRILLVAEPPRRARSLAPAWRLDTTALAGIELVVPGDTAPDSPPDLGRWGGRLVALHLSSHPAIASELLRLRLDPLDRAGILHLFVAEDAGIDWPARFALDPEITARVLERAHRPPSPDTLDFTAGADLPTGFEWLDAPDLGLATRIRARRERDAISIETPEAPQRGLFSIDIYLPEIPPELRVSFNGHPVFGGLVPTGPTETLLATRRSLQTGRPARTVLRLRP